MKLRYALAVLGLLLPVQARADAIKVVVPFAAGGRSIRSLA
jgi:hypothetical protein